MWWNKDNPKFWSTREIVVPGDTIPRMFRNAADKRGDKVIFRQKSYGLWQTLTWRELADIVPRLQVLQELERELQQRFANSPRQRDDQALADWRATVLRQLEQPNQPAELPLDLHGSAFQQRVWQALREIPSGQTRRYGELAAQLGSHARAVARACASNPIGLLVPCHRVIAANGGLSGYRWGLPRKAALLASEAASRPCLADADRSAAPH